ncbi:MAG: exopolysaccharide biosynthesis polyprenyl glycosylphosphotransferase [Verrucomicrobiota bacterium]
MFSSRQEGITRLFLILQQLGVVALLWAVFLIVNHFRFGSTLAREEYVEATILLLSASLLEFFTRSRDLRNLSGLSKDRLASVSHRQTLFSLVIIFGTMVMLKDDSLSRVFLAVFFVSYFLWISWTNQFGHRLLHRALYRNHEKGLSGTVLVGPPSQVNQFCVEPRSPQPPGTNILGYIPVGPDAAAITFPLPQLGELSDLRAICERTRAKVILLLGLHGRRDLVPPLTSLSTELGLRTLWIDDVKAHFGRSSQPYHTDQFSVVSHIREPLEDPTNRFLKRAVDLLLSTIAILTFLPPLIALVFVIQQLHSPGPLFYLQERSGRNGSVFRIFKFRTMHVDRDDRFQQARKNDSRIYKGASWLRRYSIDEFPQLLNVFVGQMSLVGPRPHPVSLDEFLSEKNPAYRMRNLSKPGLTGLAQSRGWRGETRDEIQLRNRVRFDLFYIQNWSLIFDFRIMAETTTQLLRPPKSAH